MNAYTRSLARSFHSLNVCTQILVQKLSPSNRTTVRPNTLIKKNERNSKRKQNKQLIVLTFNTVNVSVSVFIFRFLAVQQLYNTHNNINVIVLYVWLCVYFFHIKRAQCTQLCELILYILFLLCSFFLLICISFFLPFCCC